MRSLPRAGAADGSFTIVQVTPTSYARDGVIGGGERIALYLDEALRQAAAACGIPLNTVVLSLDAAEPMGQELDRYQAISGRAWQARSVRAQALIDRLQRADAVYVHQCMTEIGLFAAAHARLLGKPVYGSDAGAGEAAILRHNPDAMVLYDAVHAISAFAAAAFESLPVPVHVVPGPVDTASYRPDSTTRDPKLVLSVGRVLPHKGYERTIRALPPSMSLLIVGQHYDSDYLGFLRDCAAGKDVRLHEEISDDGVRELLHRAGLFVHASSHIGYRGQFYHKPELLGLAPLEALASGLITLVSDAGALPELGALPGCHVFRTEAELAALMQEAAQQRLSAPPPEAMHRTVADRYGLVTVGTELLKMMKVTA
jgi:glycosyltransferase involved in cell wall biosynthesis